MGRCHSPINKAKYFVIKKVKKDMTYKEYNQKMSEYSDRLSQLYNKEYDELFEEISQFQQNYMENILEEYHKTIDCQAREHIYDLLHYAVKKSTSGSSIITVETESIADEIDKIIWEEIGDYLLEYSIYKEDNRWTVDCVFGGNYVPYWDGWNEE